MKKNPFRTMPLRELRGWITATHESVEHYNRMISWVESNNPASPPILARGDMDREICETWGSLDCSLCGLSEGYCPACPYYFYYGQCTHSNKNKWRQLWLARTWHDWLIAARAVQRQLQTVERRLTKVLQKRINNQRRKSS